MFHCTTCSDPCFAPQVIMDTSTMVINGLDVTSLQDDDLYARLQDLGSPVGPIVGEWLNLLDHHSVCVCVCSANFFVY